MMTNYKGDYGQALSASSQKGGTLIVSLILLFAITLITVYSSRSAVNEQRLSKNELKSIQALHASDAGLEVMMANLLDKTQRATLLVDTNSDGQPDGTISGSIGSGDQTYHVTLTSPVSGVFSNIVVHSIGCSDACPGTCSMSCGFHKVVTQDVSEISAVNTIPNMPLIARGLVDIRSSINVVNPFGLQVVEYGTTYQGNGATIVENIGGPVSATTSTPPAIAAFSPPSPDVFFQTYFSRDKATIQSMSGVLDCSAGCTGTDISAALATTQLIWASGDVKLIGGVYGTTSDPIILIVDGNLELRGAAGSHATINGLVYVTNPLWDAKGAGSAYIYGAALAENSFKTTGNLVITYDPSILANLQKMVLSMAKVSGSWTDF